MVRVEANGEIVSGGHDGQRRDAVHSEVRVVSVEQTYETETDEQWY